MFYNLQVYLSKPLKQASKRDSKSLGSECYPMYKISILIIKVIVNCFIFLLFTLLFTTKFSITRLKSNNIVNTVNFYGFSNYKSVF